jgi:hypothetical protein
MSTTTCVDNRWIRADVDKFLNLSHMRGTRPVHAQPSGLSTEIAPVLVDEPYSLWAAAALMVEKEPTTKSTPGGAVTPTPGPRRTEGTDRLVDIMPARIDAAPPAICPLCREAALVTSTARREGAVVTGNYVCPNDHIWLERWTETVGKD